MKRKSTVMLNVVKRSTELDKFSTAVELDWRHQNSIVIHSRMRVLQFEAGEVEKSIIAIQAALNMAKERREKIAAELRGLAAVIGKR